MIESEYLGIITTVGEEGSCKTSFGLSFPPPGSHLDIDVGGWARASWRLNTEGWETHSFPKPLTDADIDKMKGLKSTVASIRMSAIPKKIEGMKELWQKIIDQIVADCVARKAAIVVDSATMFYKIGCDAYLQELQEKQVLRWKSDPRTSKMPFDENDYREKLQPMEYGVVYDRLQRVFHATRAYRVNLVLIHYPTDEYGPMPNPNRPGELMEAKTGKVIMDGYKETAKFSDLICWLSVKERIEKGGKKVRYPIARITKAGIPGMGLDAVGMEIPASYEGIVNLRNMMRGEVK